MGLFGKKKQNDILKDAVSVVLLQQTNLFQEKSRWEINTTTRTASC